MRWATVIVGGIVTSALWLSGCALQDKYDAQQIDRGRGPAKYPPITGVKGVGPAAPTPSTLPPTSFAEAVPIWVTGPWHDGSSTPIVITVQVSPSTTPTNLTLTFTGFSSGVGVPQPSDVFVDPSPRSTILPANPQGQVWSVRMMTRAVPAGSFQTGWITATASTSTGTQGNYILVTPQ